jgi:hypothetical protein
MNNIHASGTVTDGFVLKIGLQPQKEEEVAEKKAINLIQYAYCIQMGLIYLTLLAQQQLGEPVLY